MLLMAIPPPVRVPPPNAVPVSNDGAYIFIGLLVGILLGMFLLLVIQEILGIQGNGGGGGWWHRGKEPGPTPPSPPKGGEPKSHILPQNLSFNIPDFVPVEWLERWGPKHKAGRNR